ncbi:retrovirus-related pol polyprotein from transposon TNT 1-94 [Tanacetum coccineum]
MHISQSQRLTNLPKSEVVYTIQNDKSEVVYAMCKQCLITANHDVYVLNYVNDMNSRSKKQKANVSYTENQKKQNPEVKKPKKVGFKERLASPTPSEPSISRRWSPTGRIFYCNGKIIKFKASKGQSNGDNACTSNPQETSSKRFQNPTSFLGTVRFGNDHVAAILGYDLEVAFRRNTYFVRNLEGFDLLKGNRTTNLHTINLHDMATASLICYARATSTGHVPNSKQRLHLLHMDFCGPMRIESINGKQYVLVIVDDYSRYTWVHFLRAKDEAPEVTKTVLKKLMSSCKLQSLWLTENGHRNQNQWHAETCPLVELLNNVEFISTGSLLFLWLKKLLLRATLKTAPSFTVNLTKHHTSSLTEENRISLFYMYSGLSVILRKTVKILEACAKVILKASSLVTERTKESISRVL